MLKNTSRLFKPMALSALMELVDQKNPKRNNIFNGDRLLREELIYRTASMRDKNQQEAIINALPEKLAKEIQAEIACNFAPVIK